MRSASASRAVVWLSLAVPLIARCSPPGEDAGVDSAADVRADVGVTSDAMDAMDAGADAADARVVDATPDDSVAVDAVTPPPVGIPARCSYGVYVSGNPTPEMVTLRSVGANGGAPITTLDVGTYDVDSYGTSVVFAQFTMPATGHGMSYSEYGALSTSRLVYMSKTPCEMTSDTLVSSATSATINFRIDQGRSGVVGRVPYVLSGETWYLMIVDYSLDRAAGVTQGLPTRLTCTGGANCSMRLSTY